MRGDDGEVMLDASCLMLHAMSERRLLLVFAHPDDESFQGVGLACAVRAGGGRVWLITATRGQAGQLGEPPVGTRAELPAVRERELHEAARIMGVERLQLRCATCVPR